jgi:hypothetical protein
VACGGVGAADGPGGGEGGENGTIGAVADQALVHPVVSPEVVALVALRVHRTDVLKEAGLRSQMDGVGRGGRRLGGGEGRRCEEDRTSSQARDRERSTGDRGAMTCGEAGGEEDIRRGGHGQG